MARKEALMTKNAKTTWLIFDIASILENTIIIVIASIRNGFSLEEPQLSVQYISKAQLDSFCKYCTNN